MQAVHAVDHVLDVVYAWKIRPQQLEELLLVPLPELLLDEVRTGVPELAARRDVDDATRGAGGRARLARVLAPQRVEEDALEPASLTR